jgi:single-strand DNA-binding protein
MNKVVIMGRITKDLVLKTAGAGTMFMSFTVAVNRKYVKEGEERQADFISCKAFGKTAENIAKFFSKGSLILIEGRIQTGHYDNKEGVRVYTTDVMVDGFDFTGEKRDRVQDDSVGFSQMDTNYVDDIPF